MSNDLEVNITKTLPASQKDVFNAWLDPKALAKFMSPAPGMTVPKAETDPRKGGNFLIVMKTAEKELPHSGEYKELTEHEKIAFTWVSPYSTTDSLVTLTFKKLGPKETELNLKHVGFNDEESRANHEGGWGAILGKFAAVVS